MVATIRYLADHRARCCIRPACDDDLGSRGGGTPRRKPEQRLAEAERRRLEADESIQVAVDELAAAVAGATAELSWNAGVWSAKVKFSVVAPIARRPCELGVAPGDHRRPR